MELGENGRSLWRWIGAGEIDADVFIYIYVLPSFLATSRYTRVYLLPKSWILNTISCSRELGLLGEMADSKIV